ncbi:MAG: hypothetical protein N4A72_14100 [Bacteroidales bacterium]|jgi:hypothetical protein|nr:hypothetical protein [Bacteroidales bacterium]
MKRFVIIYHASADAMQKMSETTPEQKEEGMKPWYAWRDLLGDKLIDFGAPLINGTELLSDGGCKKSSKQIVGYSIIEANDFAEAKKLLKDHPHLKWSDGCTIEIHESVSFDC